MTKNKKISISKLAEKNPNWKGDKVGFIQLHSWLRRKFPPPSKCQKCKKMKPLDLANKTGIYLRDIKNFEWLCRKCHMTKDGRLEILKTSSIGKISGIALINKNKTHCPFNHAYTGNNLLIWKCHKGPHKGRIQRACRICVIKRSHKQYLKRIKKHEQ